MASSLTMPRESWTAYACMPCTSCRMRVVISRSREALMAMERSPRARTVHRTGGSLILPLEPQLRRAGMRLQPFAVGEFGGDGAQHLGAGLAHLDQAAA